jgi:hypothetical protein
MEQLRARLRTDRAVSTWADDLTDHDSIAVLAITRALGAPGMHQLARWVNEVLMIGNDRRTKEWLWNSVFLREYSDHDYDPLGDLESTVRSLTTQLRIRRCRLLQSTGSRHSISLDMG